MKPCPVMNRFVLSQVSFDVFFLWFFFKFNFNLFLETRITKPEAEYKGILDKLNVSLAKKAGQFFDGCSVSLFL